MIWPVSTFVTISISSIMAIVARGKAITAPSLCINEHAGFREFIAIKRSIGAVLLCLLYQNLLRTAIPTAKCFLPSAKCQNNQIKTQDGDSPMFGCCFRSQFCIKFFRKCSSKHTSYWCLNHSVSENSIHLLNNFSKMTSFSIKKINWKIKNHQPNSFLKCCHQNTTTKYGIERCKRKCF